MRHRIKKPGKLKTRFICNKAIPILTIITTHKHLSFTLRLCFLACPKSIGSQICSMFGDFAWWAAKGAAVPHLHHTLYSLQWKWASTSLSATRQQRFFFFPQECALAPWPEQRSRNKAHCQRLSHTGGGTACLDTIVSVFWLFRVEPVSTETASAPRLCLFCSDQGPRSRLKIPSLWGPEYYWKESAIWLSASLCYLTWGRAADRVREAGSSTCCNTQTSKLQLSSISTVKLI